MGSWARGSCGALLLPGALGTWLVCLRDNTAVTLSLYPETVVIFIYMCVSYFLHRARSLQNIAENKQME